MIKIYNTLEVENSEINIILNDEDRWSFPLEELDYLLQNHKNEEFVLIGDRLYERQSICSNGRVY